jgi:hypothetical protein
MEENSAVITSCTDVNTSWICGDINLYSISGEKETHPAKYVCDFLYEAKFSIRVL